MFKKRTVFIIGAGASAEYELPVGSGLAKQIYEMMDIRYRAGKQVGDGDEPLYNAVKSQTFGNPDDVFGAFRKIRDGILQTTP